MKYKELLEWTWQKEDISYKMAIKKREVWENFNSITEEQVKDVILKFLNAWRCRISYKRVPELLMEACKKTCEYLDELKSENILTIGKDTVKLLKIFLIFYLKLRA
jgi:N-glycosylase/DNA lyase